MHNFSLYIRVFGRLFLLTSVFTGVFFGLFSFFEFHASSPAIYAENVTNQKLYQNAAELNYANVGVAISTRIGISYDDALSGGSSVYRGVISVGATPADRRNMRGNLLSENMNTIRTYYNISQINITDALNSSSDRSRTFYNLLHQLEFQYNLASKNMEALNKQKDALVADTTKISNDIDTLKETLQNDFSAYNVEATLDDSDEYFALRNRYTEDFLDIVFINQFLAQYSYLNAYNAPRIDTMKNNADAIINKTYVVIPSTGGLEYLEKFDLITTDTGSTTLQQSSSTDSTSEPVSDSSSVESYQGDGSRTTTQIPGDPPMIKAGRFEFEE